MKIGVLLSSSNQDNDYEIAQSIENRLGTLSDLNSARAPAIQMFQSGKSNDRKTYSPGADTTLSFDKNSHAMRQFFTMRGCNSNNPGAVGKEYQAKDLRHFQQLTPVPQQIPIFNPAT